MRRTKKRPGAESGDGGRGVFSLAASVSQLLLVVLVSCFCCCCDTATATTTCNATEQALRLLELRSLVTDPFDSLASWRAPVAVDLQKGEDEGEGGDVLGNTTTTTHDSPSGDYLYVNATNSSSSSSSSDWTTASFAVARLCGIPVAESTSSTDDHFAGVTCDEGGCVTSLDLVAAGIGGDVGEVLRTLATAVGPTLRFLSLGQNALTVDGAKDSTPREFDCAGDCMCCQHV